MSSVHVSNAEAHLKAAAKCLKKSLLKWEPDHDGAAMEYQDAALAYKNAKMYQKAAECYTQAAVCQETIDQRFHSAKNHENAGICYKELKNYREYVNCVNKAVNHLRSIGDSDTTCIMLDRTAKVVREELPNEAVQFWMKAADMAEVDEKYQQAANFAGAVGRLHVEKGNFDDAWIALRKELDFYAQTESAGPFCKLMLALCLIKLKQEDNIAAEKLVADMGERQPLFSNSAEEGLLYKLLEASKDQDSAALLGCLSNPSFTYLDNVFAKLARDMKKPLEAKVAASKAKAEAAKQSGGGGGGGGGGRSYVADEDEFDLR